MLYRACRQIAGIRLVKRLTRHQLFIVDLDGARPALEARARDRALHAIHQHAGDPRSRAQCLMRAIRPVVEEALLRKLRPPYAGERVLLIEIAQRVRPFQDR